MMLSEEAGETPSSDLLVERAAELDVLSIGIPTSTPVMEITYDGGPGLVPRQTSDYSGRAEPSLIRPFPFHRPSRKSLDRAAMSRWRTRLARLRASGAIACAEARRRNPSATHRFQ